MVFVEFIFSIFTSIVVDSVTPIASATKLLTSLAIVRYIQNNGSLSLDTRAYEMISWWTDDAA